MRSMFELAPAAVVVFLALPAAGWAQPEEGGVRGTVLERGTKQPLAGVTVVATSAASKEPHTVITADNGRYEFVGLVTGEYRLTFYYADDTQTADADVKPGEVSQVDLEMGTRLAYGTTTSSVESGFARDFADTTLLLPGGAYQVGAELSFVTSPEAPGGEPLRFTDLVLFRPRARYSIKGRVEVLVGADLLLKHAGEEREASFQGGYLGGRLALGSWLAGYANTAGGSLSSESGSWLGAEAGVQWSKRINSIVGFQGQAGASLASLQFDADTEKAFWMSEVGMGGEVVVSDPQGISGGWVGADVYVPVAHNPGSGAPDPSTGGFLEPTTRVNFRIGAIVTIDDRWSLYTELLVTDRGEVDRPETTLPLLDSGFDQRHIRFGVARRFGAEGAGQRL